LNFLESCSKNNKTSIFINTRSVGSDLLHADGQTDGRQTDMTQLIVVYRNFTSAPKMAVFIYCHTIWYY